jgi:hypothetical protein
MRLILFVSALGILVSIAVLIAVIIKSKRSEPEEKRGRGGRVIDIDPK